ncbi:MAG: ATP-dependent Clp protease ATP-binding subunit [Candidatus Colwellbacteria bacterium]|nr:ATP-dependent Clp protease ATP-binding subunit [Candidatus Colwellbacteria bacterium]
MELYFKEPLLQMGPYSRVIVRVLRGIWFSIIVVATVIFLSNWNDVEPLYWIGILISLYLAERLVHFGKPVDSLHYYRGKKQANVARFMSPKARSYVIRAADKTFFRGGKFAINAAYILLEDRGVYGAVLRLGVDVDELKAKLTECLKDYKEKSSTKDIQRDAEILSVGAFRRAIDLAEADISPADVFAALEDLGDPDLKRILNLFEIQSGDVSEMMIFARVKSFSRRIPAVLGGFAARHIRHRVINRAWTSRPTPMLDLYGEDFTDMARAGRAGFLVGHREEYERLLNVLSRSSQPNALLVGEPGIGKETVVAHLAHQIIKDKVPSELFDKRLVSLNIGRLVSGAEQAELQARIQRVFGEILRAGNIILYVPDIHNMLKTASVEGQMSAADTIIPFLTSDNFPLIGTTYPNEFKQYLERDSAFVGAFEVIRLESVKPEEARKILIFESLILESTYKVQITYPAIKSAVKLAEKYFGSSPLPGSAIGLLREAVSDTRRRGDNQVGEESVIAVAETRTKVPIQRAGLVESEVLLNLEEIIHRELIDQEPAVSAVARSLREYRSGLARRGGPIGAFLFVGPTGVGKTELSKILAKLQFGSVEAMVRFDMSEYQDKKNLFQLIGSPDGTLTGALTERILEAPYSLILLDEFEKAHPDILNIFLQVLDDGRLTDSLGRVVDFTNTIIIATSNAHSDFIKRELEADKSMDEIAEGVKKKLTAFFRPELLNRFSATIVFKNLSPEDITQIARLQVKDFALQLYEEQGIKISFSEEAINRLSSLGYDPAYGARPLRRAISEYIKNPLSKLILSGEVARGSEVKVEERDGEIKLEL